jgi:hypothetical protein
MAISFEESDGNEFILNHNLPFESEFIRIDPDIIIDNVYYVSRKKLILIQLW